MDNMKTRVGAVILALLTTSSLARAQQATNMPGDTRHAVSLEVGMDSAVAASLGYTHCWRPSFWNHDILFYGRLGVPVAGFDLADSSLETGARTTVLARGNLRLQLAVGPVLRNTRNRLFSANAIGVQLTLLPGYQSERWGLMADLGYEKMFATHLRHSTLYKDTYYNGAKSGWYSDTAGTFRLGGRAGVRIGDVLLSVRLGAMISERGALHLPPFYGMIGTSYAF